MPPRPFLTQDWRSPELYFLLQQLPFLLPPTPNPPKHVNQKNSQRLNISQEQRKKGGDRERREPLQNAARVRRGQAPPHTQTQLLGRKGALPVAPELGVRWDSIPPKKHSWRPGGAVPHWAGARCLPPALVAWGAAVPTLTSSGTMLTAAAPLLVLW